MTCVRMLHTCLRLHFHALVAGVMLVSTLACTRVNTPPEPPQPPENVVPPQVRIDFDKALASMSSHDRKADWNDATCTQVAEMFLDVAKSHEAARKNPLATALYNAGLAYQRCGWHDRAKAQFQAALDADRSLFRAEVQLALHAYQEQGDAVLDSTIERVQATVIQAKFQDVDALVNLAMLQMKRNSARAQAGCEDDMSCAKLNIQRALAIDDGYMPAFNQLALHYLAKAKSKAGASLGVGRRLRAADAQKTELSAQMLDLAALVCSQAIRRNARYAPIYNTLGLIQVELEDTNGAVQSFGKARLFDPKFFEAHMNYAAVNLSFRGFQQAESAYRDALGIQPNDYEARLGLALAIRGQMDASNVDQKIESVRAELDKAKTVDGSRPEAYFNEAILIQEFEAKFAPGDKEKIGVYEKAIGVFDTFVDKAGSAPQYEEAVKNAKERVSDMREMIRFFSETDGA